MKNQVARLPEWPPDVWNWFEHQLARVDLSQSDRTLLKRLKTDSMMGRVAETMEREEAKPHSFKFNRSIAFLERTRALPELWQSLKGKRLDHRSVELGDLSKKCEALARTLKIERKQVVYWFAIVALKAGLERDEVYSPDGKTLKPEHLIPAEARLAEFLKTLTQLASFAASPTRDLGFGAAFHDIPAKATIKRPEAKEELFCIRHMLRNTWDYFDRPLCAEIATTLTVVLNRPISRARVNSTWKEMKRDDWLLRTDIEVKLKKKLGKWPDE